MCMSGVGLEYSGLALFCYKRSHVMALLCARERER